MILAYAVILFSFVCVGVVAVAAFADWFHNRPL